MVRAVAGAHRQPATSRNPASANELVLERSVHTFNHQTWAKTKNLNSRPRELRRNVLPPLSRSESVPAKAQSGFLTDGAPGFLPPGFLRFLPSHPCGQWRVKRCPRMGALPITVAGPWRIRTAFPSTEPCSPVSLASLQARRVYVRNSLYVNQAVYSSSGSISHRPFDSGTRRFSDVQPGGLSCLSRA